MAASAAAIVCDDVLPRAREWRTERRGPLMIGLCGAQGSGKSTVAAAVGRALEQEGLRTALLSLDDLYLDRAARAALARDIHPLLRTRGVPGTHEVALGVRVLGALAQGEPVRLPRFDKSRDQPAPEENWPLVDRTDVVLFEGWCVGARAEPEAALAAPVNRLEAEEDREGRWRRHVNAALAGPYVDLFAPLDRLILLAAPCFEIVVTWRREQEHALRAALAAEGQGPGQTMDDTAVDRFVCHYERLTRHILREMPARADLLIRLDRARRVIGRSPADPQPNRRDGLPADSR